MSFWDQYRASLKPMEVEEPIDRYFHRPIAYVLAKFCVAIGLGADMVTVLSIVFGLAAGACILSSFAWHLEIAAALIFISVICDCADGQIARMTGNSSPWGRLLDGSADAVVTVAVAPPSAWMVARTNGRTQTEFAVLLGLCVVTMVTSSFHTGMFDQYKNVWRHFTERSFDDGEDADEAKARWDAAPASEKTALHAFFRRLYFFYLRSQEDVAKGFDPALPSATKRLPPYAPENEQAWRTYATKPWALLRQQFGFGSLMFGLTIMNLGHDGIAGIVYMGYRLFVLNALFYGVIRPMQRRASVAALAAIEAEGKWTRAPS